MKIAVYCGSSAGERKTYRETAYALGAWMGENGHELIYGGSKTGLMGAVADGALDHGGRVTGVIPNVPQIESRRHPGLTSVIRTETVALRKSRMIELADAFVALPGGLGTLDEITEILSLRSLGLVSGPVVFFSVEGYYEPMKEVFGNLVRNGFGRREYFSRTVFAETLGEVIEVMDG